MFNDQNMFEIWSFSHWNLFGFCDLEFGICGYSKNSGKLAFL